MSDVGRKVWVVPKQQLYGGEESQQSDHQQSHDIGRS